MRIIKPLIFLFLFLVAGLGIARFIFLDQLTTMALDKAGIRNAGIHFSVLNLGRTKIDTLQATFNPASGEMLPITLKDVVLDYSLQHLLTTGKCSRVSIGTMEIKRTALHHPPPASSLSLPQQISLLRDDLRARLPLQELRINQLLLIGDFPELIKEKALSLHALINDTKVTADLQLQLTENTRITANLNSVDARQGTAVLTGMQGKEEIIKGTITLTRDTLSATADLQILPVLDLLQQTAGVQEPVRVDGSLTAHVTLPLPLQETDNIQADLTLTDSAAHQLLLTAKGNPTTRELTVLLSGLDQKQQFLHTAFSLSKQRVRGSYQFQASALRSFLQPYLQQPIPELSGKFNGNFVLPLPGSSTTAFQFTALAKSPALLTFSSRSANLQLSGKVTGRTLELDPTAQLSAKKLGIGAGRVDALSIGLAGTFNRHNNHIILRFAAKQQFLLQGITAGKLAVDSLQIIPQSPMQATVDQNIWSVAPNNFLLRPMQTAYGPNIGVTGPVTCTVSRLENTIAGIVLDAAVTTPSLNVHLADRKLDLKDVSSSFQLKQNIIHGSMQVAPQSIPGRVRATFSHDLSNAAGSFTLQTDRRFDVDPEGVSLSQLFTPWQYPFDLDKGKISCKANGSWAPNKKLRLDAFTAVTGGNGFFKQFVFNGLALRQDLAVLPRLSSKSEGSFALQQLIGAIDIHDIQAKLNFIPAQQGPLPQVEINDFSASLFAGSISSPAILYDLNQPDTAFVVKISNLDLATMIKMIKMDSLHVTGRVSGEIPVRIRGKEVSVDNGTLYSEPPGGEIRYTPENTGQTGVTGYALKAVEDFRYNSLKTTAEYLPSGQLNLDIGLQGISPELSTTRPVHLNIHAEQNLPSLLQSLRFSKGLTDELDKRVNQHYK